MKRQTGFTMIELLVTMGIVGILLTTSVPLYHTWQQRAYGSEAAVMVKKIMEAQIVYFLENDKFFPPDPDHSSIEIYHDYPPDHEDIKRVADNLHITIPPGHFLNYILRSNNLTPGAEEFTLQISSQGGFDIFKNAPLVQYTINKDGVIRSDIL